MRAEMDRFAREKKELSEQMQEVESQLEWLRSERDDEIAKLTAEKKAFQDRLHDADAQLSHLKSRKHDELKVLLMINVLPRCSCSGLDWLLSYCFIWQEVMWQRVVKEKNALAERLKNAEAARKRFDEELKRYATENVTREEIRQSLEDEVRRLTQTVGQTEGEKREKEGQVARCEAYIDGMESKLQACQVFASP